MGGISMRTRSTHKRRNPRKSAAVVVVLAMAGAALAAIAGPAQADTADDGHVYQLPPDASPTMIAQAQARATGKPVVVDALTTPYSQTTVNPDSTITESDTAVPTRVKANGSWVTPDASLQVQADGSLVTKASVQLVTLSGGGTAALARLSSSSGKSLAITMPFALPTPTVDGSTAHYADVLPDVDLDVTADILGGVREVLVVKSADAAANPALASLHLTTTGDGLTVQADANGTLRAVDAGGTPSFTAPKPTMWDSSTTPTGTTPSARTADSPAAPATGTTDPSTTDGPGMGAKSAPIPVTTTSDGLDLAPVPSILTGSDTHYPVFIDPSWLPWDTNNSSWTWIQSAHTTSDNYKVYGTSHSAQPGVGLCGYYAAGGSCSPQDTERAYYQFDLSTLVNHKDIIHSATLRFNQTYSADWSCTNTYPVRLYYTTDTIGDGTNWSNPPSGETSLGLTDNVGGTGSSGCSGNVPFAYTVTQTVHDLVDLPMSWDHVTFGLRGDESNANGLKRMSNVATLDITYDQVPVISNPVTSPAPREATTGTQQPCEATTNPTTRAFLGRLNVASGLNLEAKVSSTTTPTQPVRGHFDLWDDSVDGLPSVASGWSNGGGYVSSGSTAVFNVATSTFADGHAYAWNAYANDGLLSSLDDRTPVCHFRVDLSPPTVTVPANTSELPTADLADTFPPAGNGQVTELVSGQQGKVPFSATDPNPATGVRSGLAALRWSFDPDFAGAPWVKGSAIPTGSLSVTPTHWGTNILYIEAEDNAGNLSQITPYAFYVPWNKSDPAPVFGDTTGDTSPDVVTAGSDGNLYAHSLPGNSQAKSPAISLAATSADAPPNAGPWGSDIKVAHRGSFRGGNHVDDLVAHQDGSPNLYVYKNPGNTGADGRFDDSEKIVKPACSSCTNYATDWSDTLQVAALGDITSVALDAGKFGSRTGLVTTETNPAGDAALWFYPTITDNGLAQPTLLAATGWKNFDLISPGDWTGSGKPGLWARDRSTGALYGYTFTVGTLTIQDPYGESTSVPTLTGITQVAQLGSLSATDDPLVGSDGDLNGDGIADLWSVHSGTIEVRPGLPSNGAVASFGSPIAIGSTTAAADQWLLSKQSGKPGALEDCCHDEDEVNVATPHGVTWEEDHTGASDKASVFNGTTSTYVQSSGPALDTTKSYSVSAWVKLTTLGTTQAVVSQSTTNHQAFYLGYSPTSSWYFMTTTTDDANTAYPTASGGTAGLGKWTHLTGVYDADTHVMSLYVNGILARTGARNDTPVYNSGGRLNVGGYLQIGDTASYDPLGGAVSDVRTFPVALTAEQAAQLAGNPAPVTPGAINDDHDFTGDHTPDVVTQQADGTFHLYNSAATSYLVPAGQLQDSTLSNIRVMTSGNFTDSTDHTADIVAVWNDGTVHLYTGDGNGHVSLSSTPFLNDGTGGQIMQMSAADFDHDGHTDLFAIWNNGSIHVYLGTGTGTVNDAGPDMWTDTSWNKMKLVATADYNGDGKADILGKWGDGRLYIYIGNGIAKPSSNHQLIGDNTWATVKGLVPGDYNNDGHNDLLAVWGDGSVHLYPGIGDIQGDIVSGPALWPDSDDSWASVGLVA